MTDGAQGRWGTRRVTVVVVALVAVVAVVVGGVLAVRGGGGDDERTGQQALVDAAGPSVCRMEELVADGSLAEASNVFWDEVHTGAHVLAAWLAEAGDRTAAARYLEAKGALETAFPVLSPTLATLVPRFADAHRAALRDAGRPATADCT